MGSQRHSRDRRSSKRDMQSYKALDDMGSSVDISFKRHLQNIFEAEEHDLIVYSIREEIVERAMNEIYKKYLENQSVLFTVHCAYRALKQIIELGLFMHDPGQPYYKGHPVWTPDTPPNPSPPDSWASGIVAIRPKPPPAVRERTSSKKSAIRPSVLFVEDVKKEKSLEILYQAEEESSEVDAVSEQDVVVLETPHGTEVCASELSEDSSESSIPVTSKLSSFTKLTMGIASTEKTRSRVLPKQKKEQSQAASELEKSISRSNLSIRSLVPLRVETKYTKPRESKKKLEEASQQENPATK